MYDQTPQLKPQKPVEDFDEFMSKSKSVAPAVSKPAKNVQDFDEFMSKSQPALKSPASTYPSSPSAPIVHTGPKMLPTYDEWRKSGATDVPDSFRPDLSHWQGARMPDANGQMQDYPARELDPGPDDGAMHDTWFDANKPYKSETVTYKPKGVAPITRAVDPRARQAAQISRQINQQRDEATRLFKQADATPLERTGGNFSNVEALRAQAEGKLAAANELARRAQKTHGDLLEVGFGKDADPNSRREWAYAKPKAPKAMEESDALAIQAGNNQRFADPNGLNQALNVTPEAKARFDHQRKIEGIQQSSYPGLDPVARFGSRVWQGLKGESGADVAEAYPPVLPGEEDVNRVIQSGVKGVGSMVRGGATALPYAFPIVDAMSKGLTGRPLRSYTEGLGRPMESAIGRGAEAILPENPANQSFLAKTERGLGSMAPAMGGAIATGGGSLAAGALGALTNLGQVATERDQSKVPVSDLRRVSSDALAIATGMTEALGMGKLLNRMGLSTPLVHRLAQMVEEGGQEYAQDYLNDINAKLVAAYDPQRQINDPLAAKRLESAAIGAILGFGGEVADYAGGKLQNQIAAPSIRAERAPMQDIRPTMTGPTQVTPLTPKPTRTAAAETATPVSAIDQTVPKSTIDQTEPQIAAESPSAFPRLPEPEGFNARRAQMLGMELPAEVSINERLQKADKLASSQNENDQKLGKRMLKQTLADIQKSEGYLTEFDLPDDGPKPYTAVKNAIEARLPRKLSDSQNLNAEVPLNEQAASPAIPSSSPQNDTGQRLIEQTRLKADQAIAEGRFDDAVSELKAHQQALKDAKTAARKSPGMRTQIERQIGQVGNQIGEVRRMARDARKQANATTAGLPETRKKNAEILPSSQSADTAPLLRPEAAQNPTKSFEQIDEEVRGEFSPDTADLREVREFGKRETAAPEYTEEPPTAPLARMKNQPTVRDILRGKKGEFGKVSAFARQGERLAAHPELRKALGLPEMPPYHSPDADINPRTGQPFTNPEWGKATQETMDALSDLAGIPRSSRMGIDGLWKAHDAVSRKGAVSPSLLNAFIDTAESYTKFVERVQSFFDENSTIADVINEVQSTYEQGSELTARQESQLKSAVKNAAGEYGINANYAEKTLWPAIRDTKAEYLGESRRVAPAATERNVPVEKAAVPRNAPSSQPAERIAAKPEGKASEPAPLKRGDSVTWQSNGQTFSGKVTNVNGVIVSAQTADEKTSISRDKSKFTAADENAEGKASEPVPAPPLNVIGYNQTTDAISSPDGTIYATVRQVKKRNGATAYEVLGYSKLKGKYPDIEGIFDARTKADAIESAKEIARRTISQNAPRIAERKDSAPFTGRYTVKDLAANATAEYRPARNRPGTVYLNDWGHALLSDTLVQVYGERLSGISGDFTISAENARTMAESLNERASEFAPVAKALERAAADADANGRDVAIVTHRPGQAISRTKTNVRHETTHAAQSAIDEAVTGAATDLWLDRQPKAAQIREALTARGYAPDTHGYEAVAFAASGEYDALGLSLDDATGMLDSYFRATARKYGASALEKFGAIDPKLQPTLEGVRNENGVRRTTTERSTENTGRSDRSATIKARQEGQGNRGGEQGVETGRQGRVAEVPAISRKTREDVENSPAFKQWFGDSKVVDENGKPLVVYHGTNASIQEFKPNNAELGKGVYFAGTKRWAKQFGSNVYSTYLKIENPLYVYGNYGEEVDAKGNPIDLSDIPARYDGIIHQQSDTAPKEYVAFSPNQIKSATGNRGTFDPDSPRISERKEKRASFGELENEPKGPILASGFNIQDLFSRKSKDAKPERQMQLPKDWKIDDWAKKTYADAMVNALSPKDRAEYDKATTEREKQVFLLNAAVDGKIEAKVFELIDKASESAAKGDNRAVMEAVRDAREYAAAPATNLEKLSAMRKASMLLRPVTHARNLLGNTVFQPLEEAARIPGSIADSAMGLITGRRTLKGANPAEMMRATAYAATEGVQQAKDAMRGLDPEDLEKAFQVKEIKFKNRIIDKAVKFSFRSLNAEDKIFYTYAYDRALREHAKLTALNERKNGIVGRKDQKARAEYLHNNPTVEMDVDATTAAEVAVFRNKNVLSTGIQSARTAMGDKGSFAVDLVLPFDKTPTNIIARTLEYTPLGGVIAAGKAAAFGGRTVKEYRAARKEGAPSKQAIKEAIDKAMTPAQQRSFSLLVGRSVTGTAAPIALGYFLAAAGMATGAYDEDDRKENAKRRETNTPPSSIKIGGRWYQIGGLPPLGSLVAMGATLHEEVNKEGSDAESIILGTAKGVGGIASDVPLLRSTKDAVEGLTKEGRAGQKVGRIASSFVPSLLSDIGQLTPGLRDEYERQTRSDKKVKGFAKFGRDVAGEVAGKIPGLRKMLPIKTDGSGRKIETELPDPFDPFSSRPALDSADLPGIKGERSRVGLSNTELKQKTGEPDAIYQQRVDRVNGWMETYGQKLIDNPRYKALPEDQQKAAIESLRRRIGTQQNAVKPNEKSFEPSAVLLSVQKSAREKPKKDAKKLWVAPPR